MWKSSRKIPKRLVERTPVVGQSTGSIYSRSGQQIMQLRSNDTLLNSEPVLQAYLNGFEYHRDKDKQSFIHSLHQILPLDFSKVIFVGLLLDKAKAIFSLADLVAVTIGKQKEIGFSFFVLDKDKGQRIG